MDAVYAIAWYACGLFGGYFLFRSWARDFYPGRKCPSPIGLAAIVVGAALGPFTLIGAAVERLVMAIEQADKNSWFKRPLCERRERKP